VGEKAGEEVTAREEAEIEAGREGDEVEAAAAAAAAAIIILEAEKGIERVQENLVKIQAEESKKKHKKHHKSHMKSRHHSKSNRRSRERTERSNVVSDNNYR
jgi:hypothetical protein